MSGQRPDPYASAHAAAAQQQAQQQYAQQQQYAPPATNQHPQFTQHRGGGAAAANLQSGYTAHAAAHYAAYYAGAAAARAPAYGAAAPYGAPTPAYAAPQAPAYAAPPRAAMPASLARYAQAQEVNRAYGYAGPRKLAEPARLDVRYKTKMCLQIVNGRPCAYGDKCKFAHSESELRRSAPDYASAAEPLGASPVVVAEARPTAPLVVAAPRPPAPAPAAPAAPPRPPPRDVGGAGDARELAGAMATIARAKDTDGRAPNALLVEVLDVAASLGAPALARALAWCGGAPPDTALAGAAAPDDGALGQRVELDPASLFRLTDRCLGAECYRPVCARLLANCAGALPLLGAGDRRDAAALGLDLAHVGGEDASGDGSDEPDDGLGEPSESEDEGLGDRGLAAEPEACVFDGRFGGRFARCAAHDAWTERPAYARENLVVFHFRFSRAARGWWVGATFGRPEGLVAHCASDARLPPAAGWHVADAPDGPRRAVAGGFRDADAPAAATPAADLARRLPVDARRLEGCVVGPHGAFFGEKHASLVADHLDAAGRARKRLRGPPAAAGAAAPAAAPGRPGALAFSTALDAAAFRDLAMDCGDAVVVSRGDPLRDAVAEGTCVEIHAKRRSVTLAFGSEAAAEDCRRGVGDGAWRLDVGPPREPFLRRRDALAALVAGDAPRLNPLLRLAVLGAARGSAAPPGDAATGSPATGSPAPARDAAPSRDRAPGVAVRPDASRAGATTGRRLLVLADMNGTLLVRTTAKIPGARPPDLVHTNRLYYYLRERAAELVAALATRADVVFAFYTSMQKRNAEPAVRALCGPGGAPELYAAEFNAPDDDEAGRRHAWDTVRCLDKVWAHDGAAFGFDATNTVMVDDTARKMRRWPGNVLVVDEYDADAVARGDDDALSTCLDYVGRLADALASGACADVRTFTAASPFRAARRPMSVAAMAAVAPGGAVLDARARAAIDAGRQEAGLDDAQAAGVLACCSRTASLVLGPPGSGKTTVAAHVLKHWAATLGLRPALAAAESPSAAAALAERCAALGLNVVAVGGAGGDASLTLEARVAAARSAAAARAAAARDAAKRAACRDLDGLALGDLAKARDDVRDAWRQSRRGGGAVRPAATVATCVGVSNDPELDGDWVEVAGPPRPGAEGRPAYAKGDLVCFFSDGVRPAGSRQGRRGWRVSRGDGEVAFAPRDDARPPREGWAVDVAGEPWRAADAGGFEAPVESRDGLLEEIAALRATSEPPAAKVPADAQLRGDVLRAADVICCTTLAAATPQLRPLGAFRAILYDDAHASDELDVATPRPFFPFAR